MPLPRTSPSALRDAGWYHVLVLLNCPFGKKAKGPDPNLAPWSSPQRLAECVPKALRRLALPPNCGRRRGRLFRRLAYTATPAAGSKAFDKIEVAAKD